MMGRTEGLARELRHARGDQHAQLGADVPRTTGQHVGRVIHHHVDDQLVNELHGCELLPPKRCDLCTMTRDAFSSKPRLARPRTSYPSLSLERPRVRGW